MTTLNVVIKKDDTIFMFFYKLYNYKTKHKAGKIIPKYDHFKYALKVSITIFLLGSKYCDVPNNIRLKKVFKSLVPATQ